MRELETLFIVIGVVTVVILIAYWKMGRKARPKKSRGWTEPKV
ncbi:MAG: hypothetical protein OQK78_06735 [Gammaproteobacteria bacterium]|nr:hypothetical protein [Gammaproteobacteria bacterium]MCW8888512.1 hypothetical protein [Gammaproteobacteria bacterium]